MEDKRKIYSVAELNRAARFTLENSIGEVWVEGELSRVTLQSSGHWYFTLKDEAAAVSCAMFKQNNASVLFAPKDGLKVRVLAQASLYEPRGSYQLIVRKMEEAGKGSLQEQFEKLKAKLAAEGLFDASRKKPLPMLPQKIGVVTSPTGAAVRDIINVLTRRFPNLEILLAPVPVQGDGAAEKIAAAITYLNKVGQASSLSAPDAQYFIPFMPLDIEQRHLPHWTQPGATYFITFRLADSLPREKLELWHKERDEWAKRHPAPYSDEEKEEYACLFSERINQWLDAGSGSCLLAKKENARIVEQALQHFDGIRYKLGPYVIMANHVHALVSPNKEYSLTDILHSWKSFTANEINKVSGTNGTLWQDESYDHIVRSPEELTFYTHYIQKNVNQSNGTALTRADRLEACPTFEKPIDILIVGRGGGSIEDLWAFNEEVVARAIAASHIPVISAVGHEIDFTISDFVADVRAPTPSAAAELAVSVKTELETQLARTAARLSRSLKNRAEVLRERIPGFRQSMVQALRAGLRQRQQRVDEATIRLTHELKNSVAIQRQRLPRLQQTMIHRLESSVTGRKQTLRRLEVQLRALNPLAVLDRGYSLTQSKDGAVIRDAASVKKGDTLKTRFAKGTVKSEVIE
ncbi:MAG: exodeoxyribonuclease VII large subunit [Pontiellaceae bacterium]|jgi:exodeoxyribonuclease VII large subunit|nr:exodeoxyribonuclease VII large subunit [Pontiellaceae bacterium]